jgi:threonine dehydrogenase-like Zn-dependent dehydrogenase
MECQAVGQVVASRDPSFQGGEWVLGGYGWQTFSARPASALIRINPQEAPPSTALGVLGMPGLTAWVGLSDIGQPKAGETVVVSAASGAVGQVVGQLAKIAGARVVGIAGGAAKCDFLKRELGFDAAVDHRGDLAAQLDAACPDGVDVYWENVGGAHRADARAPDLRRIRQRFRQRVADHHRTQQLWPVQRERLPAHAPERQADIIHWPERKLVQHMRQIGAEIRHLIRPRRCRAAAMPAQIDAQHREAGIE